jgi:hypothetical protein
MYTARNTKHSKLAVTDRQSDPRKRKGRKRVCETRVSLVARRLKVELAPRRDWGGYFVPDAVR